MGNDIAKLFGIEKEERGLITILLIQSVFLGTFYGVFNITAHSLFLAKFSEILMARAYILSGLVGIGLTWLYTLLQSKMRFDRFSGINLAFVLFVTLALWFIISVNSSNWAIFAIFILMGPLNLLALLSFYGTTGRLFTLRQGRRLFGFVDTGIVVGVIISSFSIPALLSINVTTSNILLISAFSILGALIMQAIIGKRYSQVRVQTESKEGSKASMKMFRDDKYIRAMGMFIAFSVVVAFFIQYSFMAVTRARYPLEHDLASFLGLFEGSMMVFTLLIKTFIFSYLIKNHGLKVTLAIGPVLIGIFIVIAVIVGSTMGYLPETTGFMVFFLILALSRLFSKAMKDSLETPAFKVLYQTLAEKVRYNVQSAIDGTVNEIAALTSGLLLTGLGALTFVKLIHFSWVLSLVIAFWIYTAITLYSEYRKSVRKSIDIDDTEKDSEREEGLRVSSAGSGIDIVNDYFYYIRAEKSVDYVRQNTLLLSNLLAYASNHLNLDMLPLFRKLAANNTDKVSDREIKDVLAKLEGLYKNYEPHLDRITEEYENAKERRVYASALFAHGGELIITDLIKLMRDKDWHVRKEAIYLVGKHKVHELLSDVCDCLNIPSLTKDAYCVLKIFGESAFEPLSTHYFRSSGNTYVKKLIIRLFGETKGEAANEFLFPLLWSVHRDLRLESLEGLIKCGFSPDEESTDKLIQEINDVIGVLSLNIAASVTLKGRGDEALLKSLTEETRWWTDFLFGLLALVYDKRSFDKIRSNLEGGTVESVNLALEMIDIVVDESVKPRLTALLDVVGEEDKLKNLFQFYPGELPDYDELVVSFINTDYNRIGVWTKACALKSLYNIKKIEDPDFIIALLFSPNMILREEALRYLQHNFKDVYSYCSYRVPEKYQNHLTDIIAGELSPEGEIFNKIQFLSEQFKNVYRNHLVDLALDIRIEKGIKSTIGKGNNFIAWRVGSEQADPLIAWRDINHEISQEEADRLNGDDMYIMDLDALNRSLFDKPELTDSLISYLEEKIN